METVQAIVRSWLAEQLKKHGRGARSALAKHLRVRPEVISRFLNTKPGKETREISLDEAMRMAQFFNSPLPIQLDSIGSFDDDLSPAPDEAGVGEFDPDLHMRRTISSVGRRGLRTLTPGALAELDIRAAAGAGQTVLPTTDVGDETGATYSAHLVVGEWILPQTFVRGEMGVSYGYAEIIRIKSESMEPMLFDDDRVVIDRKDTNIKQGGIFCIREGEELVIKRVELLRGTDPPRLRCSSVNPAYQPYELNAVDENGMSIVVGRAVARFGRLRG